MAKAKKALAPVAGSVAGVAALSVGGAYAMLKKLTVGTHEIRVAEDNKAAYGEVTASFDSELWGFTSFDGLKLKAHHFSPKEASHVFVVLVHGYYGNYTDMMPYALHYLSKGYEVVMPHLRGHGLSEGNYVGFGYHDHYDLCGFVDLIKERDPECKIILHGMSMGAATVLMASGEYLPGNVKCVVADSSYTNAFEQCTYNMKNLYKLPHFPLLDILDVMMRLRYKYSLKECAPIRSVAHATTPILFIHGEEDDFVPFYMQEPLYEACSSEKEKLAVPGARHVASVFADPDLFWKTTDAFTEKYLN